MPLTAPFLNNKCTQIVLKITKLRSVMNSATLKLRASSGKEPACQHRRHKRHGFYPWIGKIPRRRARQPTPGFLPGESQVQRSLVGIVHGLAQSDTTEGLSTY